MAKEELNVIIKAYNKTGTAFKGVNRGLGNLRRSALNLKFALASVSGALAVKTLVKASVDMQKMTLGLKGATGGAESGAKEFAYLNEVVDRLKLDLKSSGEAFTLLTAAARGTSLEGQQTRDAFEAIAISSKVLGRSASDTEGVLYALQQMISKGRISSEELRRQMGDRLPGAFKMAAKAMNMTESELDSAMRKGEVYSTDFIPRFTKVLMDAYGKQLPAALKTTASKMSELSTAMFRAKAGLAESGLVEVVLRASDAFIEFSKSKHVGEVIAEFGSEIKKNKEGIKEFLDVTLTMLLNMAEAAGTVSNAFLSLVTLPGDYSSANKARDAGLVKRSVVFENRDELRASAKVWNDLTEAQKKNYEIQFRQRELARELSQTQSSRSVGGRGVDQTGRMQLINEEIKANNEILIQLEKEQKSLDAQKDLEKDIANLKIVGARSAKQGRESTSFQDSLDQSVRDAEEYAKKIKAKHFFDETDKRFGKVEVGSMDEYNKNKAAREKEIAQLKEYAKAGEGITDMWLSQAEGMKEANARAAEMNVSTSEWLLGAKAGLTEYSSSIKDIHSSIENTVTGAFQNMEDAIVSFATTGKLNFTNFAQSIISDMMRIAVQQRITGPLAGALNTWLGGSRISSAASGLMGGSSGTPYAGELSSFFSSNANGNAFGPNGLIKAFASGGVVNSPTVFPFANGTGLMGEAGPEGILPLKRVNGKLGVTTDGASGVNISQNFDLRNADESSIPKLTAAAYQIKQETLAAVRQSLSRGGDLYTLTRG